MSEAGRKLAMQAIRLSEDFGISLCDAIEKLDSDGAHRHEMMAYCEDVICADLLKNNLH